MKFEWMKEYYPADFNPEDPDERRSIFRRKSFQGPNGKLVNPPFDEQEETKGGKKFDLFEHIIHVCMCARAGQVPTLIATPYRPWSDWWNWAKQQEDVTRIIINQKFGYLRGTKLEFVDIAPFQTVFLAKPVCNQFDILVT